MAKHNAHEQSALTELPIAHQRVLGNLAEICETMPPITEETGVTWMNGQNFYQLYLSADRFSIASDDWLLSRKI